jgi:hypothetical protein
MNLTDDMKCLNEFSPNYEYYIQRSVNLVGLITNSICILVFSTILKNNSQPSNMFGYFLVKSINDFMFFLIIQYEWIFYCGSCESKYSYFSQIWYIYIWFYLAETLLLASNILEIVASIDCYILLTNKFQFFRTKLSFYLSNIVIYVFSLIYNTFFLFENEMFIKDENKYYHRRNENTIFDKIDIVDVILREYLVMSILVVVNTLILRVIRKMFMNRRNMNENATSVIKAMKAQRKKFFMIISMSINFFMLHLFYNLNRIPFINNIVNCKQRYFELTYNITYSNGIIFYIFFNKNFRKTFFDYLTLKKLRSSRHR